MIFEIAVGAFMVGSFVYHRWIEDHPRPPRPADIELPRVDEGTAVPLVYGRCRVRQPTMVWAGNFHVPAALGTGVYRLDMMFVVGIPFNGGRAALMLEGIFYGDIRMATVVSPSPGVQPFAASLGAAYGDVNGEGWFFDGSPTQDVNAQASVSTSMAAAGVDTTLIPGYRNQVCCVFVSGGSPPGAGGLNIGFSSQVSSFGFEVRALSTGSSSDLGNSLADDADPAAVIYDLLTSPWGKLALPASKIDLASFQAASATLVSEGNGYSRSIEQAEDAPTIIGDVLRQIDGMIYEEPTTGKLVLKLVRLDYDPNNLFDINTDNVVSTGAGWYSVKGWSETPNQVRVTFTERSGNYSDGLAIGQDQANSVAQGGKLRSVDLHYPGCNTADLAQKLASRELLALSTPLVKVSVTVNRSFYAVRPGDALTLTWPELGVNKMVMRVVRVDLGQLHDGAIRLDLIRDIFGVTVGAFPAPA